MDGECIKYNTITKSQVFKILKRLQPYVKLEDSPEYYKEPFVDGVTLFALLLFIIYLALKFMFNVGI